MKKKLLALSLCLTVVTGLFTACGQATNTDSLDTSEGETEITTAQASPCDTAGHTWVEATCEAPKTCSVCEITEGNPLDHEWTYATTSAPKTCSKCGLTDGGKVVIKEYNVSDEFDSFLWHYSLGRYNVLAKDSNYNWGIYDTDCNLVASLPIDEENLVLVGTVNRPVLPCYVINISYDSYEDVISMDFYDTDGNIVMNKELTFNEYLALGGMDNSSISTSMVGETLRFYNTYTEETMFYMNLDSQEFIARDAFVAPDDTVEYDETKYGYYEKSKYTDYIFAANADESEWFFMDNDENILASYLDVSDFTPNGFAVASNDRESYFIIDTDFNVVSEENIEGNSGFMASSYGLLAVKKDDVAHYYDVYIEE